MNKKWSELNKTIQTQIKKEDTYKMGLDTLLSLRSQLMQTLVSFKEELCREAFNSISFLNADGYHSKTIAYSIWHIFRIEDIVMHTVINEDEEELYSYIFEVQESTEKMLKQLSYDELKRKIPHLLLFCILAIITLVQIELDFILSASKKESGTYSLRSTPF